MPPEVIISDTFDDIRLQHVRFIDAAARLGAVHIFLPTDEFATALDCRPPKFPLAERRYFLESLRFVSAVTIIGQYPTEPLPPGIGGTWITDPSKDTPAKRNICKNIGLPYRVLTQTEIECIPLSRSSAAEARGSAPRKKILVTGCYDWLHTGHIRFFEEVSAHGDVYAVVGHDANITLLKGQGHPHFPQDQRRYMVGAIRFVTQSLISTGHGWLDAEPEIQSIKPDIYAVNEDGDKPEKRAFCQANGIQYLVLKRTPKPGLPARQSTTLRGF